MPAEPIVRRRPILVWVICAFYVIGIVVTIPTILALTSGAIALSPAATEYYQSFGVVNYLGVLTSAILAALAAGTLFRMRRSAFAYASAGFVVTLLKIMWYWPVLRATGVPVWYQVFTIAVGAVIVLYVWRLWSTDRLVAAVARKEPVV